METDDKITAAARQVTRLFLDRFPVTPDQPVRGYSLTRSFDGAGRNRMVLPYVMAALFLGFAVVVGITATVIMAKKQAAVSVDIQVFDDLKLKTLLFDAGKLETRARQIGAMIKKLARNHERAETDIHREAEARRRRVLALDYAPEERKSRLDRLDARTRDRLDEEKALYEAALAGQQRRLDDIMSQLGRDRSQADALGLDPEVEGDAVSKWYDMRIRRMEEEHAREMDTLVNRYEKKLDAQRRRYNPIFVSDSLKAVVSRPAPITGVFKPSLGAVEPLLQRENVVDADTLEKLEDRAGDLALVMKRIQDIPYENSVPPALYHIEALYTAALSTYEGVVMTAADRLHRKNRLIRGYETIMTRLVNQGGGEAGYVVDAGDPNDIQVFLSPAYPVKTGDTGLIFRGGTVYIGRVTFFNGRDGIRARLEEAEPGRSPAPFDLIIHDHLEKSP